MFIEAITAEVRNRLRAAGPSGATRADIDRWVADLLPGRAWTVGILATSAAVLHALAEDTTITTDDEPRYLLRADQ